MDGGSRLRPRRGHGARDTSGGPPLLPRPLTLAKLILAAAGQEQEAFGPGRQAVQEVTQARPDRTVVSVAVMLALDTNALVRWVVREDEAQYVKAKRFIEHQRREHSPILVSLLVLLKTEWVLRSRYQLSKANILATFSGLLDSADVFVEDDGSLEEALFHWEDSSAEFADCLIGARHRRPGLRVL